MQEDIMVQQTVADPVYVLGRSEAEAQRLMLQAQFLDRLTRRFLADAGLAAGMTVLDVGSGAGDVAFAAADLVGPTGRVVGVDVNPTVLALAEARARAEKRENVSFVVGDCRSAVLPDDFDAAVGRYVLMYTGDMSETLQEIVARVKPGGIVAFAEADFASFLNYVHAGPEGVNRSLWEWKIRAFACADIPTAMVAPLYRAFVAAGLGAPEMALQAPLGGGDGWSGYEWAAATLHSLLPVLEQYGIGTAEIVNLESLAARCRAEVASTGVPLMLGAIVTAWARKPLGV
jgi:ubiquinone/menaquinone biosynthesis C-methylase UbiE